MEYKIFNQGEKQMIERLVFPRFVAEITFDQSGDLTNVKMIDECIDVMLLARAMREAADYMIKNSEK